MSLAVSLRNRISITLSGESIGRTALCRRRSAPVPALVGGARGCAGTLHLGTRCSRHVREVSRNEGQAAGGQERNRPCGGRSGCGKKKRPSGNESADLATRPSTPRLVDRGLQPPSPDHVWGFYRVHRRWLAEALSSSTGQCTKAESQAVPVGRRPARVTATRRSTAAFEGRPFAAARAWTQ